MGYYLELYRCRRHVPEPLWNSSASHPWGNQRKAGIRREIISEHMCTVQMSIVIHHSYHRRRLPIYDCCQPFVFSGGESRTQEVHKKFVSKNHRQSSKYPSKYIILSYRKLEANVNTGVFHMVSTICGSKLNAADAMSKT